jgi:isopropylmalate/homocitrate/citramalate synthase
MVEILDSTLREGEQTPYVNFLIDEKIEIARLLDRVGVDMIEAGDPSVSPSIFQASPADCRFGPESRNRRAFSGHPRGYP